MINIKNKKEQSILEYIIGLSAIVALVIWAATKFVSPAVNTMGTNAAGSITAASGKL